MRYKIKCEADNFESLKKLSAEFGTVAVVLEKRYSISVEVDESKEETLTKKVLRLGGKISRDYKFALKF